MKQPEIHQNVIGKRELAEFNAILDSISNGKIKYDPIKADEFKKQCKIGKYREWEVDLKRIEEINELVKAKEAHMHPDMHEYQLTRKTTNKYVSKKKVGDGLGGGKLQRAAEFERLKLEIENG